MNFHNYKITDSKCTVKQESKTKDEYTLLSNFYAEIKKEITIRDGITEKCQMVIVGGNETRSFKEITIPSEQFASLSWVMKHWGANAVISPEAGTPADLRTAIQLMSTDIEQVDVYQHTGWTVIDDKNVFLHCKGGISAKGFDASIVVDMPKDMSKYSLPDITSRTIDERKADWTNSLSLIHMCDTAKSTPLLAATYRAAIGSSDFAVHCTGKSGSFKSEVASLMQCHFGIQMDARNLPGSWNGTANSLEAKAFRAKDCLFVVDDFIPVGSQWQVQQYQKSADQLIRGQGNQQGRSRLTDVSSLQETMYPRGLVLSTGEDTPEGQSLRGRMLIIELSKGDVKPDKLTEAQKRRESYPRAMAGFIQWLADMKDEKTEYFRSRRIEIRDANLGVGHTRTPAMIGDLVAAAEMFLTYGESIDAIDSEDMKPLLAIFNDSIVSTAADQTRFIEESDPAESFISVMRNVLMARTCHLKNINGGQPRKPELVGWKEDRSGSVYQYSACGSQIGWVDEEKDIILLDADVGYETLRSKSGGRISITATTLWKRLKESDLLAQTDHTRKRNTVRVVCEGQTRKCVILPLSKIIETDEDDDEMPF